MKSHKTFYFENVDNLTRIVVIRRKKKFRNKFNKIMYWAHCYKWDRAIYKKYNDNE